MLTCVDLKSSTEARKVWSTDETDNVKNSNFWLQCIAMRKVWSSDVTELKQLIIGCNEEKCGHQVEQKIL